MLRPLFTATAIPASQSIGNAEHLAALYGKQCFPAYPGHGKIGANTAVFFARHHKKGKRFSNLTKLFDDVNRLFYVAAHLVSANSPGEIQINYMINRYLIAIARCALHDEGDGVAQTIFR
jgi:hypothetical protein